MSSCYTIDNSNHSQAIGTSLGAEMGWITALQAAGGSDVITEISASYGDPGTPTLTPGMTGHVYLYDDPTNDYDFDDAVLLYSAPITIANENTETFNRYAIPNVPVTGLFYIGVSMVHDPGQFPAAVDSSPGDPLRCWITWSAPGLPLNLNTPNANSQPPVATEIFLSGHWFLRAESLNCDAIGQTYCVSGSNSVDLGGSDIAAMGSPSLGDMDLTLTSIFAPPGQGGLFFYSGQKTGGILGCGRLCVGGSLTRMPVVFESGGMFSYDVDFTTYGSSFAALGTVYFQLWYRDPANQQACGSSSNSSNGVRITFTP